MPGKAKLFAMLFFSFFVVLSAQSQTSAPAQPDLTKTPTLFVVGYAHLDTEWRWEYPQVISEFLPKTMHDNFDLFEKYPHYIFNFSGANRYRIMKEYYPDDYKKIQQYVAAGRWFPAGSSMEESDVNSPSAESIFRQILYGNRYFRHDFNKTSAEYMLPDCFGFPASLPSILAHAGIKGFSTQKLTWHSAAQVGGPGSPEQTPVGIPFNVGLWYGLDGKSIIAALNPGDYSGSIYGDLSKTWDARVNLDGKVSGLFTDYHYYGTGDTGGSPRESSVKLLEAIVTKGTAVLPPQHTGGGFQERETPLTGAEVQVGDGPLHVVSSNAEQMFLDIKPGEESRLPTYKGDLELIEHSAGSLTSEAYQKRWNRKNELLADAAERASVAAAWLGGRPYPQDRLNKAWTLVMGGQFHDIMAGTATPQAYEFSWNDDIIAMNQFATVLTDATEAIASGLNTQSQGVPVIVYNPLNISREDVAEADLVFQNGTPASVRAVGPDGRPVPAQVSAGENGKAKVLFLAKVPSVGFAVYDIQPAESAPTNSRLKVNPSSLENARYRIHIDQNGDVSSIFDKELKKELLAGPARLAFQTEIPHDWPAWNMDWTDQQKPPRGYVAGQAQVRVVENGPVRVAVEITREAEDSKFVQTIRLAAGDAGNRIEFANAIDWKSKEAALKATFPLTASNPEATYNWDIGTIQRGNNNPHKYEVASHQWFDLTDKSGAYGVTVLSDCKNGSDKPNENTLRLTLIYTPGIGTGNGRDYSDQSTQDWGHHEFIYGLAGHRGNWVQGQSEWQALRLNQPLITFTSDKHPGALGKSFSLLRLSNPHVRVLAVKKAEDSDDVIVRMVEMDGKPEQNVRVSFAAPVTSAQEMNAQEEPLGSAQVQQGSLVTSFTPYQPRTFALKLAGASTTVPAPRAESVRLRYDRSVGTDRGAKPSAGFDDQGNALPAEMLPQEITYDDVPLKLAPANAGDADAVTAKGQMIQLPSGNFNRVYVLAASADGDQKATFRAGDQPVDVTVQDWGGFIGQWFDRTWNKQEVTVPPRPGAPAGAPVRKRTVLEYSGIQPAFIKRASLGWYASFHRTADGKDVPYSYSYLFVYPIDLPAGATTLTLPDNYKIRILAITATEQNGRVRPAQPLYDVFNGAAEEANAGRDPR